MSWRGRAEIHMCRLRSELYLEKGEFETNPAYMKALKELLVHMDGHWPARIPHSATLVEALTSPRKKKKKKKDTTK